MKKNEEEGPRKEARSPRLRKERCVLEYSFLPKGKVGLASITVLFPQLKGSSDSVTAQE